MAKLFRFPTSLGVAVAIAVATAGKPPAATAAENRSAIASTAPAQNAAPLYRAALAKLTADPALGLLNADDTITPATEAALAKGKDVLDLLRQAAALPRCDWAEDLEAHIATLGKLRWLAAIGLLQARADLARGEPVAFVQDVTAVMALARHIGQTPLFVSKLVEIGILEQTTAQLAAALPDLPRAALDRLAARMEALPRSATYREAILGEHAYALMEVKKGQGGFDAATIRLAKPWYIAVADAASLPPEAFAAAVDAELAKLPEGPARAFAGTLIPVVKPLRVPTATGEAREAMLRTAVEVVVAGAGAVDGSKDPFGKGAFEYRKLPRGFELRSKLKARGQQVSLRVGPPLTDAS